MTKREQIIEILKKHQHSMAGHNWLIGLDESDFILIADAILALFEQKKSKSVWMTAKEFLFSKYPLVSLEWFNDNELTQEMIRMMEQYLEYAQQPQKVEQEEEKPTDEEIEKWADENYGGLLWDQERTYVILGAKAMRDNPKAFKSK